MGILRLVGRMIATLFATMWNLAIFIAKMEWLFVTRYIHMVNEYTGNGTLGIDGSAKETHWSIRYPIRIFLWLFVPVVIMLVPVGIVGTTAALLVSIDQITYPSFPIDQRFVKVDATPQNGSTPSVAEIGSALLTASYHQMETELDSSFGWTPNDTLGLQFFDNRINRQLGVRHASVELLSVLVSNISKFGNADAEDPRLTNARQSGFTNDPTYNAWTTFPFIETRYYTAIENIRGFQGDVLAGKAGTRVNITNANIAIILDALNKPVLSVPYGKLTSRNYETSWFALDDDVFFAQGSAIVARDALVVIKNAYKDKITERGAMDNLNQAIDSLNGAIDLHPWWIMQGDGDSMFADHRSKLARYYSEAINRIKEVADALRG